MAFETATYTDVYAREAVDGIDGFNFQSVSPGVTGVDQQRIRESLLHRIVTSWTLNHDALTHPATCAYVVRGGVHYLSRGHSTGTTNSGRPGNQLTRVIMTSDPDDFVPYRPAQLFGAQEWTLEKAVSTSSDLWLTPLDVRPDFEVAALADLVTQDPWGRSILPQLVTMVEQAVAMEPTRLVLVHHDLDVVMSWIALATLFVDSTVARRVQFRALVDDPMRVDAHIVGASPEFELAGFSTANVVDLVQRTVSPVDVSATAQVHSGWFLGHEPDDALNAIDVARRWSTSLGPELADQAARVVALPDGTALGRRVWETSMSTVEGLAEAGLGDDLALYAEELCDAVVGHAPSEIGELSLAGRAVARAHQAGVDAVATGVLVPTMEALTLAPSGIAPFARELAALPDPLQWDTVESRDAAGALLGELLGAAPTETLPDLFVMARIAAAPVAAESINDAVQRLADSWAANPALGRSSWKQWMAGPQVLAATVGALVAALGRGDDAALRGLLQGEWDFLESQANGRDWADWVEAARIGRSPIDRRAEEIATARRLPDESWRIVLSGAPLPLHASLWATWIGFQGCPPSLAAHLHQTFEDALASSGGLAQIQASGDWTPLLRGLQTSTDPRLATLAREHATAESTFRGIRDQIRRKRDADISACLPAVARLAPLLLPQIGWVILRSADYGNVARLVAAAAPWGPRAVRDLVVSQSTTERALRTVGDALALRYEDDPGIAAAATEALDSVFSAQPELLKLSQMQPRLKRDVEEYLADRQPSRKQPSERRGAFGRKKEK